MLIELPGSGRRRRVLLTHAHQLHSDMLDGAMCAYRHGCMLHRNITASPTGIPSPPTPAA